MWTVPEDLLTGKAKPRKANNRFEKRKYKNYTPDLYVGPLNTLLPSVQAVENDARAFEAGTGGNGLGNTIPKTKEINIENALNFGDYYDGKKPVKGLAPRSLLQAQRSPSASDSFEDDAEMKKNLGPFIFDTKSSNSSARSTQHDRLQTDLVCDVDSSTIPLQNTEPPSVVAGEESNEGVMDDEIAAKAFVDDAVEPVKVNEGEQASKENNDEAKATGKDNNSEADANADASGVIEAKAEAGSKSDAVIVPPVTISDSVGGSSEVTSRSDLPKEQGVFTIALQKQTSENSLRKGFPSQSTTNSIASADVSMHLPEGRAEGERIRAGPGSETSDLLMCLSKSQSASAVGAGSKSPARGRLDANSKGGGKAPKGDSSMGVEGAKVSSDAQASPPIITNSDTNIVLRHQAAVIGPPNFQVHSKLGGWKVNTLGRHSDFNEQRIRAAVDDINKHTSAKIVFPPPCIGGAPRGTKTAGSPTRGRPMSPMSDILRATTTSGSPPLSATKWNRTMNNAVMTMVADERKKTTSKDNSPERSVHSASRSPSPVMIATGGAMRTPADEAAISDHLYVVNAKSLPQGASPSYSVRTIGGSPTTTGANSVANSGAAAECDAKSYGSSVLETKDPNNRFSRMTSVSSQSTDMDAIKTEYLDSLSNTLQGGTSSVPLFVEAGSPAHRSNLMGGGVVNDSPLSSCRGEETFKNSDPRQPMLLLSGKKKKLSPVGGVLPALNSPTSPAISSFKESSPNQVIETSLDSHVRGEEVGAPHKVHTRLMGWKLTSLPRRTKLISMLDRIQEISTTELMELSYATSANQHNVMNPTHHAKARTLSREPSGLNDGGVNSSDEDDQLEVNAYGVTRNGSIPAFTSDPSLGAIHARIWDEQGDMPRNMSSKKVKKEIVRSKREIEAWEASVSRTLKAFAKTPLGKAEKIKRIVEQGRASTASTKNDSVSLAGKGKSKSTGALGIGESYLGDDSDDDSISEEKFNILLQKMNTNKREKAMKSLKMSHKPSALHLDLLRDRDRMEILLDAQRITAELQRRGLPEPSDMSEGSTVTLTEDEKASIIAGAMAMRKSNANSNEGTPRNSDKNRRSKLYQSLARPPPSSVKFGGVEPGVINEINQAIDEESSRSGMPPTPSRVVIGDKVEVPARSMEKEVPLSDLSSPGTTAGAAATTVDFQAAPVVIPSPKKVDPGSGDIVADFFGNSGEDDRDFNAIPTENIDYVRGGGDLGECSRPTTKGGKSEDDFEPELDLTEDKVTSAFIEAEMRTKRNQLTAQKKHLYRVVKSEPYLIAKNTKIKGANIPL